MTTLGMTDVFFKNCSIVHLTYENTVFTVEEIINPDVQSKQKAAKSEKVRGTINTYKNKGCTAVQPLFV